MHRPRIVIYGVGQYGKYFARFAVQKGWTIVAAYNRAGPKIGKDLGQVAEIGRDLGVVIQDCETANYDNLDADIGIVAQTNILRLNLAAYKRLMNAGLNVLCHGSQSYYPYGCDPETAAEIDVIARKNKVTFTGSGIWDMSRIWAGILVAGPCTEIKSLFHSSVTDVHGQSIVPEHATQLGIGLTVEEFMAKGFDKNPICFAYKTIPEHVLAALGFTISNTTARVEPIVFDTPVESWLMGGTVPAGICVGSRIIGEIETKEGVTARAEVDLRLVRDGDVEHMFWSVEGKPRTRVRTERLDSAHATASCLFNRIPDVISAKPGIVLISQMGPLKQTALI